MPFVVWRRIFMRYLLIGLLFVVVAGVGIVTPKLAPIAFLAGMSVLVGWAVFASIAKRSTTGHSFDSGDGGISSFGGNEASTSHGFGDCHGSFGGGEGGDGGHSH